MARFELKAMDSVVKSVAHRGQGRETEFRITGNPGLILVVQRSGQKSWRVDYSVTSGGGRQKRKVGLGSYPATTLAEARQAAANYRLRVEREGDVIAADQAEAKVKETASHTFSELVEVYLDERKNLASIGETARELHKDVLPTLGTKLLSRITPGDIDALAQNVRSRGAPVMARRLIAHIKALYNYVILDRPELAEKYDLKINPAERLGRRRRGAGEPHRSVRTRYLDDGEIARWWETLDASHMRLEVREALRLVLVTGQRPGEVRQLRRSHLDLSGTQPIWTIPAEISKNRRAHSVPMTPLAMTSIGRMLDASKDELLVPDPKNDQTPIGKVVLPSAQSTLFRRYLPDIAPATVHDLRRTAASGMRSIGIPPHTISSILNHAPVGVTQQHYIHSDVLQERMEALQKWANHIEALVPLEGRD